MAKYCPECGTELNGAKFCPECGTKITTDSEPVNQSEISTQEPANNSESKEGAAPSQNQEKRSSAIACLLAIAFFFLGGIVYTILAFMLAPEGWTIGFEFRLYLLCILGISIYGGYRWHKGDDMFQTIIWVIFGAAFIPFFEYFWMLAGCSSSFM